MDYQEFLVALEQTPRDWKLIPSSNGGPCIRRSEGVRMEDGDGHEDFVCLTCPINAVAGRPGVAWWIARESLGFSELEANAIACAADASNRSDRAWDPAVRADLLRACGLEETGG